MYKYINSTLLLCILFNFTSCQQDSDINQKKQVAEIDFELPNGFTLEQLYHPSENEQGSWVSLAQAPENKMYACDQRGELYYFETPKNNQTLSKKDIIPVNLQIGQAHGLLWAFNSLYVSVNKRWEDDTTHGSGIYRLTDTDNNGELDKVDLLLKLEGDGEHGPHSFALSPNGMNIYFIAGNHTLIPDKVANQSQLPKNWNEDNLFSPYLDARGHATDIKAPGGWIAKFNSDGSSWNLISAGYRNPFDLAFNTDGELFTYDSDMEWDIGMPWYRPTRICHVTSGSEYGWRTGSAKWPAYYPDNLPAIHNLEQGSPTAVLSASKLKFPSKYKNGLLVTDWSFGTVYFIDLKPKGSSYEANREIFLSGTPLPLTDMIAGNDGNLYFATGGRNLDSRLYRLSYTGKIKNESLAREYNTEKQLRTIRQKLESFHVPADTSGLAFAWKHLDNPDRFIAYAARIVLEHRPVENWISKLEIEQEAKKIIPATIALARNSISAQQKLLLTKLNSISFESLTKQNQVNLLRAYGLSFIRQGKPTKKELNRINKRLNNQFPNKDNTVNKELAQLLLFMEADGITKKLVDALQYHTSQKTLSEGVKMLDTETTLRSEQYGPLIREVIAKMPPSEAIYYGLLLSNTSHGWTQDLREKYFLWFYDVLKSEGGRSFKAYMENVRQRALSQVPELEKEYFQEASGVYEPTSAIAEIPQPIGPGKHYTGNDLGNILWGPNYVKGTFKDGKRAYQAGMCMLCHGMRGEGGAVGPDLTQTHTKFNDYDLIFAIYSPNDEISDQYANTLFNLKDGKKIAGRIKSENDTEVILMPNPYNETYTTQLDKKNILSRDLSPVSPMPSGLLNRLSGQEIKDLINYIQAGGDAKNERYTNTD